MKKISFDITKNNKNAIRQQQQDNKYMDQNLNNSDMDDEINFDENTNIFDTQKRNIISKQGIHLKQKKQQNEPLDYNQIGLDINQNVTTQDGGVPEIAFNCSGGRPIQLISYDKKSGKFQLNTEAAEELFKIDKKIAIVCLVGAHKTGKSFLLNKLLDLDKSQQFYMNSQIPTCTEGIWLWSKPVYNERDDSLIYFLDTEGLPSIQEIASNNQHQKLFFLSILLSSYFMFNSIGPIDDKSLKYLSLLSHIQNNISIDTNSQTDQYSLSYYAPTFLWILRDFNLEELEGNKIPAAYYLENSLTDSKCSQLTLQIKQSINNFFKNRDCLTLTKPVNDDNNLKILDEIPLHQLKPNFLKQLHSIRDKILVNCQPKTLNGIPLNPRMFCSMLEKYIEEINSGQILVIQTAWQYVLDTECIEAYNEAITIYNEGLSQNFMEDQPKFTEELYNCLKLIREDSIDYYTSKALIYDKSTNIYYQEYRTKLETFINDKEKLAFQVNNNLIILKSEQKSKKLFDQFESNITNNEFDSNSITDFIDEFIEFLNAYENQMTGQLNYKAFSKILGDIFPRVFTQVVNQMQKQREQSTKKFENEQNLSKENEGKYIQQIQQLDQQNNILEQKLKKEETEKIKTENNLNLLEKLLHSKEQDLQKIQNSQTQIDNEYNSLKSEQEKLQQNYTTLFNKYQSDQKQLQNRKKGLFGCFK